MYDVIALSWLKISLESRSMNFNIILFAKEIEIYTTGASAVDAMEKCINYYR